MDIDRCGIFYALDIKSILNLVCSAIFFSLQCDFVLVCSAILF